MSHTWRLLGDPPTHHMDTPLMRLIPGRTWSESWEAGAGADERIRREKEGTDRDQKGSKAHRQRESRSPWKTQDAECGHGFQLSAPPSTSQNPPSGAQSYSHLHTKPLHLYYVPTKLCGGFLPRRFHIPGWDYRPPSRQFSSEALRPEGYNARRNRTQQPWVIPPTPILAVLHNFSFSEFYVQPAIKTGKTSEVLYTPQSADVSILLIIQNLSKCKGYHMNNSIKS